MVELRKAPPKERDVARPVANLGNTCYMNAVLQALAHAPELCMAMDVEPHYIHCPIFLENAQKRRSSPSSSPEHMVDIKISGTRKSKRSSGKKSPTATHNTNNEQDDWKFCALCEVEQHLVRVHSTDRDKPVAPSVFVNGFINQVAPWFKLGQQEDSHEFLRILIDAMQRSCKQARTSPENPQDTPPEKTGDENEEEENGKATKDVEYPFQLFRGMVESNVTCGSCRSTSSTMDPIEDIGLDVTPLSTSSSSSSPTPAGLADVSTALQRFARAEALDAGYKCEKCGKVGRATKQSRLASIPPILTLHLKRFRYGETQSPAMSNAGQRRSNRSSEVSQLMMNSDFLGGKSGSAKIEGHSKFEQILDLKPYLTEEMQAKHSKMFCRLFAVVVHAGKNSHSGHYVSYVRNISKNEWWKMDDARITLASVSEVMNAEAYMLFYRVVEHPFAVKLRQQERQLQQEWAKDHPQQQKQQHLSHDVASTGPSPDAPPPMVDSTAVGIKADDEMSQDHPKPTVVAAPSGSGSVDPKDSTTEGSSTMMARPDISPKMEDLASIATSSIMSTARVSSNTNNNNNNNNNANSNHNNSRKRKAPEYTNGEDWARAKTNLPDSIMSKFRDIETIISEYVQFKPEFFKFLADQASRRNAKVGHGPSSGICEDDVKDGTSRIKRALLEVFYELDKACVESGGSLFRKRINNTTTTTLRDKGMVEQQASQPQQSQPLGVLVSSLVDPDEDPLL